MQAQRIFIFNFGSLIFALGLLENVRLDEIFAVFARTFHAKSAKRNKQRPQSIAARNLTPEIYRD